MSEYDEIAEQYNEWTKANQPKTPEAPPDPAAAFYGWDQQVIRPDNLASASAAVPKGVVKYLEDPSHTEGLARKLGSTVLRWTRGIRVGDGQEMAVAWGQEDKLINRIGEDQASLKQLRDMMADRGLVFNAGQKEFTEALSRKMTSEFGPNWRGRLPANEEEELLGAAGLALAVAQSTVANHVYEEYDQDVRQTLHSWFREQNPGYEGDAVTFNIEMDAMRRFADNWKNGAFSTEVYDKDTIGQWYAGLTGGQPWDGTLKKAFEVIGPEIERLQNRRTAELEAHKWRRLGVNVSPDRLIASDREMRVAEVPFAERAKLRMLHAIDRRVSRTDPYSMAWENATANLKERIVSAPAKFLGELNRGMKEAPGTTPLDIWMEGRVYPEQDPDKRYRAFLEGWRTLGGQTRHQNYYDILRQEHTADVARQRAEIIAMDSREKDWSPELAKTVEESSYKFRADALAAEEQVAKHSDSLMMNLVAWAPAAAAKVAEFAQLDHLSELTAGAVGETIMDANVRELFSKQQLRQMPPAGKLGDYINDSLGTKGMSENWTRLYAIKRAAGAAGFWDEVFYTGGALVAGMLEMPGFATDQPYEALAMGKILHGLHKARTPVATTLRNAGVPAPLVAAAELAMDPIAPGVAANTLLGRDPKVIRTLGVGHNEFIKGLKSTSPEYAAKAMAAARAYADQMQRGGFIRDNNKVQSALAVYASLLSRSEAGERIRPTEIHNLADMLAGESPEHIKRMFAPFARHGESYAQGLEPGKDVVATGLTYLDEHRKIMENEIRLQAGRDALTPEQKAELRTPAQEQAEAFNAFQEGKYADWRARFDTRLGRLVPKAVRDEWLAFIDKRIDLEQNLPYAQAMFIEGSRRLADQRELAGSHSSLMRYGETRANHEAAVAESALFVARLRRQLVADMARGVAWEARPKAEVDQLNAVLKETHEKVAIAEAEASRARALANLLNYEQGRVRSKASVSMSHVNGEQTATMEQLKGLEEGYRSTLKPEARRQVSDWLWDLAVAAPEELGLRGMSKSIMDAANEAQKSWEKATAKQSMHQRALYLAGRAFANSDNAAAAKFLRSTGELIKGAEDDAVLGGMERLRNRIRKADAEAETTHKASFFRKLEQEQAFHIPALDKDLATFVQNTRKKVSQYVRLGESNPTATLADMLKDPSFAVGKRVKVPLAKLLMKLRPGARLADVLPKPVFAATERMMGIMIQQTASTVHQLQVITTRLKESINDLPLADQRTLAIVNTQHPSSWPADLPAKVRAIAVQQAQIQSRILTLAERAGVISREEATRLRGRPYTDRFYVSKMYQSELEQRGITLQPDTMTENIRLMQSAPLMRLSAARSTQHARVIYTDWKNGGITNEQLFEVGKDGTATSANRAAQKWVDEKLADGSLREGEYMPIVEALSKEKEAELGLVDSNGQLRADSMAHLFKEVTRQEMFAQVAQFGGLVRHDFRAIPAGESGSWQEVKGKEWGTLDGTIVHKSLIKQINSWTGFSDVLDAIIQETTGALATNKINLSGAEAKTVVGGGKVRHIVDLVDSWVRQNFIPGNPGSWNNNVGGNAIAFYCAGVNLADPRFWRYFSEFSDMYDNLERTEARAHEAQAAGVASWEQEFFDTGRIGFWQRGADAPTEMTAGRVSLNGFFDALRRKHERTLSDAVRKCQEWNQARTRAENQLALGEKLTDDQRADLTRAHEVYSLCARETLQEVVRQASRFHMMDDIMELGKIEVSPTMGNNARALATEAFNFFVSPDSSMMRQIISSRYSQIDAKFKWAAYRYFREVKGMSPDASMERVARYGQNFGAVHPWVRGLKRMKVIGGFVPGFPAEALRTGYNAFREDPGRVINALTAVAAANAASWFSQGMLPSDVFQLYGDDNSIEQMRRMFLTLHVPTPDGMAAMDFSQWTAAAPFLQPTGVLRPRIEQLNKSAEESLGLVSLPVQFVNNFATNFVLSTPGATVLEKPALGVDSFTGELAYERGGIGETLAGMFRDGMKLFTPAFITKALDSYTEYARGPTSIVTKYNRPALDRVARYFVSGEQVVDRRQRIASLIAQYAGPNLSAEIYADAKSIDDKRYKAAVYKAVTLAESADDFKALFEEALKYRREMSTDVRTVGGQTVNYTVPEETMMKAVLRDMGANIYATIERLPPDVAVQAVRQLMGGIGRSSDPEVRHLWTTLTDPEMLKRKDDVPRLLRAAVDAYSTANQMPDPFLANQFSRVYEAMLERIVTLKANQKVGGVDRMVKSTLGGMPEQVATEIARRLGYIQ